MRRGLVVVTGIAAAACLLSTSLPALADQGSPSPASVAPTPTPSEPSGDASPSSDPSSTAVPASPTPPTAPTAPTSDPSTAASSTPSELVTTGVEGPSAVVPSGVVLVVPPSTIVMRTVTLTGTVEGEPPTGISLWVAQGGTWSQKSSGVVAPTGEWSMTWLADTPGTVSLRAVTAYADGTSVTSDATSMLVVAAVDAAVSSPLARTDVPKSYRNGCPVPPESLRRLVVNYRDYSGKVRRGTLVVAASAVTVVQRAFTRAFADRFRIKRMTPVDAFYGVGVTPVGSDVRAMNAGNTSAFNCRGVTGSRFRVSQHSFGTAIDINTFENPYVTSSRVYPAKAKKKYVTHRAQHLSDPGVLRRRSGMTRVFLSAGWAWGGFWSHRDWQHFSVNGR